MCRSLIDIWDPATVQEIYLAVDIGGSTLVQEHILRTALVEDLDLTHAEAHLWIVSNPFWNT
jgi:hypothetical protein